MKSCKKIISLILSLATVIATLSVLTVMPVNAVAGDVWTLNHTQTSWEYYYNNTISHDTTTQQFSINGNKNKDMGEIAVLLSNDYTTGDGALKSNTRYKIKFNLGVGASQSLSDLYVAVGLGTSSSGTWINKTDTTTHIYDGSKGDLAAVATQVEWNQWSKWDIEIIYDTNEITGNAYFVLAGTVTDTAYTYLKNITVTEVGTYKEYPVVDSVTQETLGTVKGFVNDDAYDLIAASEFNKQGYQFSVEPAFIEEATEQLVVTYSAKATLETRQEIDFGNSYGGHVDSGYHYFSAEANYAKVTLNNGNVKFDGSTSKENHFGQRAVLLANDYTNSGLTAGYTYRITLKLSTYTQWTPLTDLNAEIRCGNDIWDNTFKSYAQFISGEELQGMVTGYEANSNGSVIFTISMNVTLPEESKWASGSYKNILFSLYGGEAWISYVKIEDTATFDVVDEAGNKLGVAHGLAGDKAIDIIPDSLFGSDYTYTASPEVITENGGTITINKALNKNIVQKINVNNGNFGSNWMYLGSRLSVNGDNLKGTNVCYSAQIGNVAVAFTNDLSNTGLEAGEKYRLYFEFSTTHDISLFEAMVGYGTDVWNVTAIKSYNNSELSDCFVNSGTYSDSSNFYFVALDVTLPTGIADNQKVLFLSLYGNGSNGVNYYLKNMYVYKQSSVNLSTYDETVSTTVKGFEGDAIDGVISADGSAKFINITDKFGSVDKNVYGNVIYRGDANADFAINSSDLTVSKKYLLGVTGENDCDTFGADANGNGNIDILDLVHLKKKLAGFYDDDVNLPSTLTYNDYALAWNCEFSDITGDEGKLDSISGVAEIDGVKYVTVGDKNCVNIENGVLNISPKYNYGNMLAANAFSTQSTMNFAYGYFEIRAKLSYSSANHPAIWFKSDGKLNNSLDSGMFEYDLIETFGSTTGFNHNIHYWDSNGNDNNANHVTNRSHAFESNAEAAKYHTYGFEWYYDTQATSSKITLYVDGQKQGTLSASDIDTDKDFSSPIYLILQNHPITGAYYNTNNSWISKDASVAVESDFPMDMCIDYIRLYQSKSNTGNVLTKK